MICTLLLVDVHLKDIVGSLLEKNITDIDSFEYQKYLRFYYDEENKDSIIR
jgi:hypothetical protein